MTRVPAGLLEPANRWFQRSFSAPRRYLREGIHPDEQVPLRVRIMLGIYLTARALIESDLTTRAAATAYTFIFSLIPLLTTTLAFLTAFPSLADQRESLQSALFSYLLPGAVRDVQLYLDQFAERAAAAGTVSSLVFFVSILFLFETIEGSFNRIFRVERARTWGARFQLLALFFIVGALAATLMVTVTREATALAERVRALGFAATSDVWAQVGLKASDYAAAWAFFIVANKVLPNTRVRWVPAIVGGVVAGTLWQFLKSGFTWYVTEVASYENIYGAVGTVPVFFLWLYLTFLLLLGGAYVAFVVQNFRALVATQRFADKGRRQVAFHAVAIAATLAQAYRRREGPISASAMARRLGVDTYFITESVDPLVKAGIVLKLELRAQPETYLLAVPAETLTVGEVVRMATLEDMVVPEVRDPSPMHGHIADLFRKAQCEEGNVLERLHVDALAAELPESPPEQEDEDEAPHPLSREVTAPGS